MWFEVVAPFTVVRGSVSAKRGRRSSLGDGLHPGFAGGGGRPAKNFSSLTTFGIDVFSCRVAITLSQQVRAGRERGDQPGPPRCMDQPSLSITTGGPSTLRKPHHDQLPPPCETRAEPKGQRTYWHPSSNVPDDCHLR